MSKKDKTLCKWKKDEIREDMDKLRKIVDHAHFICGNCGRAVSKKKWVCKPIALD